MSEDGWIPPSQIARIALAVAIQHVGPSKVRGVTVENYITALNGAWYASEADKRRRADER